MSDSSTSTNTSGGRAKAKPCTPTKKSKRLITAVRKAIQKRTSPGKKVAPDTVRGGSSRGVVAPTAVMQSPEDSALMDVVARGTVTKDSSEAGTSEPEFFSASASPGSPFEEDAELRTRRSSESDLAPATSTPGIPLITGSALSKPRSESSLLRIKAQLRAAAAADLETSIRQAEEPRDVEKAEESYMSDISCIGGGALHEMPRLANALLQRTKTRLEESRNLNRDIREDVCSGIHGLYEMVLRLADSRNRHIADKEKQRAGYERRLSQLEAKHAAALASLHEWNKEAHVKVLDEIKGTHKEAEATRWIAYELDSQGKEAIKSISNLTARIDDINICGRPEGGLSSQELQKVQADIATLRLELGTLNMTLDGTQAQRIGEPITFEDIRMIKGDVAGLRQDWQTFKNKSPHDPSTASAAVQGIKEEMEKLRKEVNEAMADTKATYSDMVKSGPRGAGSARVVPAYQDHIVTTEASSRDNSWNRAKHIYAQTEHQPQHGVLLESADPRKTSGDILKEIQSTVDVIDMGIRVNKVAKLSRQRVLINCDTDEDRKALKQAIQAKSSQLTISTPQPKHPLIRLIGVVAELSDEKVKEALFKQNSKILADIEQDSAKFRVIRRTKARNDLLVNIIAEVSPALWAIIKDQRLRIGYQVITAVDHSPILQCYNCLGYGHKAGECRAQSRCGYCAESHSTRDCANRSRPALCANCNADRSHPAYSQTCPEWQKWDRIARNAVAYC